MYKMTSATQRLDAPDVLALFLLISLGYFGKPGIIVFPEHIILILLPHFEYRPHGAAGRRPASEQNCHPRNY